MNAMASLIGQTISHYKILEKLGEGGMGVVYKAEDLKLTRTVALKFLPHGLDAHEPERKRFLQEARAAAILNQPNICTVYDIQEHDGQQFIVMEYVEGKTLREIVPVRKMQDAIGYAIQIAEALQEAHTHGIIHRDIKADNIMVNTKNQVKVMDFGLAKLKGSLKLTKTSSTIGTLAYMAPEQIKGEEVDTRSDIFSFGIVLYEMLTGHLPFRGEHEAAMVYSIVNEEPEPLQHFVPDAPSELLHILDRALEKDREERYQTVHEMLIDLRRLKKDSARVSRQTRYDTPMPVDAPPAPTTEGKKGWRKQLWLGVAGLAVLCVIPVVYLLLRTPAARLNPSRTTVTLGVPFKELYVPSLSRDGNWVAFFARGEDQTWDVYMMNIAGGKPIRVTHDSLSFYHACDISPDVSQVVYDFWNGWPLSGKIRLVASQGAVSQTLADTGFAPKWRPDGARIGYIRLGRGGANASHSGKLEIWSMRSDGTDNHLEFTDTVSGAQANFNAFSWSPDGGSIAWVRTYPEGYSEVMVRELATGRERQLTSGRKNVDEVIWAANHEILFTSNKSGQTNLWMIPAGGGELTQVTQGAVPIMGPRISADNKTLVYIQQEEIAHIWISSIDGSNARQITSADIRLTSASFSPDGKHISYIRTDVDPYNPQAHLYVMDRDGKNQRQLTSGSEVVDLSNWSPDSRWIAVGSRTPEEHPDSSCVFLIKPSDPGPPRLLCKGKLTWLWWADNESLDVVSEWKTLRYPIKGGMATPVGQDSTFSFPLYRNGKLVIYDYRERQSGLWVVPVDVLGRQEDEARKKLIPSDALGLAYPRDLRFWIYNRRGEVWRTWTYSGKKERIGTALPGETWICDVGMDGKEILWISKHFPTKLVLVKNVFE
jgi:serine/threonine protein kinase/Tol biopolymer transport system component